MSPALVHIIIVCEKENIIAIDLVRSLSALGFKNIKTCNNGITLLNLVSEEKPHLILSNIHLQKKYEGLTTLKEIHKLYPDIKIIFFTNHNRNEIKFIGGNEITSFTITKPYSIDNLQSVIEECLNTSLPIKILSFFLSSADLFQFF